MNSNFTFLADMFPEFEKTGSLAEGYLHTDPNTCLPLKQEVVIWNIGLK